ncbi:hypothetical protein KAR91_19795 [Candidatus Pacearchaeota archaeon]|nr:hypothetical protein [Candidatus Pacearchaeota archaeon]
MKKIAIAVSLLFLLAGCGQSQDAKIVELEKQELEIISDLDSCHNCLESMIVLNEKSIAPIFLKNNDVDSCINSCELMIEPTKKVFSQVATYYNLPEEEFKEIVNEHPDLYKRSLMIMGRLAKLQLKRFGNSLFIEKIMSNERTMSILNTKKEFVGESQLIARQQKLDRLQPRYKSIINIMNEAQSRK